MSTAAKQIRAEIEKHGPIPFARFMELALYCPLCGYYEKKEDTTGKRGDFFTSVSVGPLFGALLAFQFCSWFELSQSTETDQAIARRRDARLQLIEAGAHDGRLAADILSWIRQQRPDIFDRLDYHILEPSPSRQSWQSATMQAFEDKVQWFENLSRMGPATQSADTFAVIFSNELLDAFPVHRLGWDAKRREWFEWGVTVVQEEFAWVRLPVGADASDAARRFSAAILDVLPDGFTTEFCPVADRWWRASAAWLLSGKLLTFDYGLTAEEFLAPQRANGTLRAYYRHQASDHLLAQPGDQDLTAHVNFSAILAAGESAGLITDTETSQARFLTDVAREAWRPNSRFGQWTQEHTRQFQTLTHPNHLGSAFRVLLQSRAN